MENFKFCLNERCSCAVSGVGDVCCGDCARQAKDAVPGACQCGHEQCEPKGIDAQSERADALLV